MKAYATVGQPVVDLRREPTDIPAMDGRDEGRLSQLLYNEKLLVTDEQGDWLGVEAMEQRKFLGPEGWGGYPGWVRKKAVEITENHPGYDAWIRSACAPVAESPSAEASLLFYLSFGTRLSTTGEAEDFLKIPLPHGKAGWVLKKDVTAAASGRLAGQGDGEHVSHLARLFLGVPYLWGGRSMPLPTSAVRIGRGIHAGTHLFRGTSPQPLACGVDCSGLVNLVFRALGHDVPRDALDQWRFSRPIGPDDLRPGDLIFLSRGQDPLSIDHVLLSLGGDRFIEAPHTGEVVRMGLLSERLACDLRALERHDFTLGGRKLFFGRIEGERQCPKNKGDSHVSIDGNGHVSDG